MNENTILTKNSKKAIFRESPFDDYLLVSFDLFDQRAPFVFDIKS
jgi:hypothetical protein